MQLDLFEMLDFWNGSGDLLEVECLGECYSSLKDSDEKYREALSYPLSHRFIISLVIGLLLAFLSLSYLIKKSELESKENNQNIAKRRINKTRNIITVIKKS